MRDEFGRFHPTINLIFFITVIAFSMFQMQAVLIAVSFISVTVYYFMIKNASGLKYYGIVLLILILSSIINPLFSHRGVTTLFYFPTGNACTLESVAFGFTSGVMIAEVLLWFSVMSNLLDDERLMTSIGKVTPIIATMISMVLRFIPKFNDFSKRARLVQEANGFASGNKLKNAANIFSITTTWALESSLDTADSMRARGFNTGKRTNYSNYKIKQKDIWMLVWIGILALMTIISLKSGQIKTTYYPSLTIKHSMPIYIIYTLLCLTPAIINLWEAVRWHISRSKI